MAKIDSIIPVERIQRCIYVIRGHKVMLDSDLAMFYGVETRVLKQTVSRNIDRFRRIYVLSYPRGETGGYHKL